MSSRILLKEELSWDREQIGSYQIKKEKKNVTDMSIFFFAVHVLNTYV